MRVRSALLAACLSAGACITHPQPNPATIEMMQTRGWGGYIQLTSDAGETIVGELLAVEADRVWIQNASGQHIAVDMRRVKRAALYKYDSDWGLGLWGLAGTVSTISHGFLLVFTFPIWVLSASIVTAAESYDMRIEYPESSLETLRPWARYPQGMPRGIPKPPQAPVPAARDQAWTLTKQAKGAARAGTCDQVRDLDVRVRELDPDLHEATFIRDEAIRRCLGLPSLLVPPGQTPPTSPAPPAPLAPPSVDAGVPVR